MEKNKQNIISRESLGVEHFDSMIEGGVPTGSVTGISGPPGAGKSILSMNFLLEGARKGQKCVYVNLEEPRRNIDNMINRFDFAEEFKKYEKEEKIIIRCFEYSEYEQMYPELLERIREDKKIKRLVIDSFNCFFHAINTNDNSMNIRKLILESFYKIRNFDLTTILILEKSSQTNNMDYNIPYLIDGEIKLEFLDLGIIERHIIIPKMRWTNQHKDNKLYEINSKGISKVDDDFE